jgi:hypothetical protein
MPYRLIIHTPYTTPCLSPQTDSQKTAPKNTGATFDLAVRCMYKWLMDLDAHRPIVAKTLLDLETAIERLVDALSHRPVTATIDGVPANAAIRTACEAYSAIDYEMEDEITESVVCLGVIGAQAEVLKRAQAVNAAKAEMKKIFAPLQRIRVRVPQKGSSATKAIPALRVILRNIQRSDLNIHAAYRKIPILDAPPATVTYTRANTRNVYRKTIDEVADMLANLSSTAAIADRERLNTLYRRETHLALVRLHYQNIRANILYIRLDPRGRGRIQISAELPLLYATGRRSELPEVNFPDEAKNANKPQRIRESILQPQPFLHSLPVYRYAILS